MALGACCGNLHHKDIGLDKRSAERAEKKAAQEPV